MSQVGYKLRVSYSPNAAPPPRRDRTRKPLLSSLPRKRSVHPGLRRDAIRGVLYAIPLSALLWAPIIWGLGKVF